jgi:hypothetical protein
MLKEYFAAKEREESKHTTENEKNQRSGNEPWTSSSVFVTRRRISLFPGGHT